ncbi:MAG: UvrD-helicase domain-containing protein [bacterium]
MGVLTGLNERQREAVEHGFGPLLVLAGAGSGKTKVLTHRIAFLLEQGVKPHNILAITFTNKAAQEMQARVESLVGQVAADIWIMTFHAACVRILRREARQLGYKPGFVIYDKTDQLSIVKEVLKELNLDEKRYIPQVVLAHISKAKNELVDAAGFVPYLLRTAGYTEIYARRLREVFINYQAKLMANNAMDFDDLLVNVVTLWQKYPHVLHYYRERFRYVLVDEYQDTNHVQYLLVKLLATEHGNVFVVGDDYQSIYGFRGADLRNILHFERDFINAKVIKLEQNYRSTQNILAAANGLMAYNVKQKEKTLWTAGIKGDKVKIYRAEDERLEAAFVARQMQQHYLEGYSWQDFAILYRTNAQSRVFEEVLRGMGIPYRLVGTLGFYDRKEIKDLVAYLRLLENPADDVSLRRVINTPRRGIGAVTMGRLEAYARLRNLTMAELLYNGERIPGVSTKAQVALQQLGQTLKHLQELAQSDTVSALIPGVLTMTGYRQELEQEHTLEAQTRLENLEEFISVAREQERCGQRISLEDFLAGVALISDTDTFAAGEEAAVMMTVHNAKGLEFPVVFLVGMEEGIFPHCRSLEREEDLEEERRLCYVGITRAQKQLYMLCARRRMLYGHDQYNLASRFLQEIPPEVQEEVDAGGYGIGGSIARRTNFQPAVQPCYAPGDKVQHKSWGMGTVVSLGGQGEDMMITVAFPGRGIKTLMLAYAPLVKVDLNN